MTPILVSILLGWMSIFASSARADWMADQETASQKYLLANISAPGTSKGSVVASPSRKTPNYFFHWIRDAGLVMRAVVKMADREKDATRKKALQTLLADYAKFSRSNQTTSNPSDSTSAGGLGEPKFEVDGKAFTGDWGRPQNDGPALRALALIDLAQRWLTEGREKEVRSELYDSKLPSSTSIKTDLEFVSHRWMLPSFDIWEEISGHHFYTRMVQRRALLAGADLADRLGDAGAATWYRKQAKILSERIADHWDNSKKLLLPTLGRNDGIDYKTSGIDTQVLLAVLHAEGEDGFFNPLDARVLATLEKHISVFDKAYGVNRKGYGAVALGRYPEDRYDGYGVSPDPKGNAWFLTTAAVAELHYRVARLLEKKTEFHAEDLHRPFLSALGVASSEKDFKGRALRDLILKVRERGDRFLARACFHGLADGHLSEQIHRETGYMEGAHDLTWSYAAFLTAFWQR